jgi:hypothetical protein
VLYLGLSPNCSSRSNPRPLTTRRILDSRIFSNSLPNVSSRLMGHMKRAEPGPSRVSGSKTHAQVSKASGNTTFEESR